MEYIKVLKNVTSFSEYIQLTEDAFKNNNYSTIEFNMSAVLDLKEMRYYEIQYFKNYGTNGIAYTLFEQMLALPASKKWNFLGKEMVLILRFWLKAMKEILLKNQHWWTFMDHLLILIKDIRTKHTSLPDMLVEQLTEYLLYVATEDSANVCQKFEILHCLNIYCAESSRNIRLELRNYFEKYFVKLSSYMASCGHLPCQFSILETLLRWIIPRCDPVLRSSTAQRWFRKPIFKEETINIFLERPWLNFFQDARDFLNAHNGTSEIVVSVKFSTMMIGDALTIPEMWLDVNSAKKHTCISVLLLPRVLRTLQPTKNDCSEALTIKNEDIQKLTLVRKSLEMVLLIKLTSPPTIEPSHKTFDDVCDLVVNLDPHSDFKRLDSALRAIFSGKYEANLDLAKEEGAKEVRFSSQRMSQSVNKQSATLDNGERFSQVDVPQRSRVGGYVCTRNNQFQNKTLSSTSTSSLLLLRDVVDQRNKQFLNERMRFSAVPDLSPVSELTESIERPKYTAYGVTHSSIWNKNQIDSKTTTELKPTVFAPINTDDVSCLLVATIGSTDESVINDTLERVSKNTNYEKNNIVDLLIHEALEKSTNAEKRSNKPQPNVGESAENIPIVEYNKRNKQFKRKCTVISRSTSNESHTEYNQSPSFITKRKRVFTLNQVDVEQCLNKLIDEVCAQLDKLNKDCNKSMKKKEFDTEDERPLICLAKKQIGQKPKKKGTMIKKDVKSVNTINQKEIPSVTNNVSISNITIHSPEVVNIINSTIDNNHPKRKRKLYSPKFEQMDSDMSEKGITKSTTSGSKLQDNKITNKTESINTFYKDNKTQKKTRIRAQPKRKNRSKQVEQPSPKTELMNKVFDQLKETQDNTDDVVYVDKNEYKVFNYSSDSDDFRENIKMLREKNKKNISATGPVTVNKTTNNKNKSRRKYVRKKNINIVGNNKIDSKRSKLFKRKLVSENNDLVDEKMRSATSILNNSILLEKSSVVNEEEPVLVLDSMPEMEFIGVDEKKDTNLKPTSRKKRKVKQTYKRDTLKKGELCNNADKTQSPLPELFIEPALPIHQDNTSNMDTDAVIKIINRIRESKHDSNVDLLSENESKERNVNKNTPKSEQTQFNLRPVEKVDITASTRSSKSALAATSPIHSVKKCDIIKTSAISSTKSRKGNNNRKFNRSVSSSMKVYRDSNESSFNTSINIKTTPRKLDIEGYDAAAKNYYRKVMNDSNDRSGEISIPDHLESCRNSNGREETRSELSGNWEPRVILEDIHESSVSDRRSDIEDKSVKVNSRKAVVPITAMRVDDTAKWLPSSSTSLANATKKSVTKTSMNKKLYKLNNTVKDTEANERVQSRVLLSKTANDVSDEKTPKSSSTSADGKYKRKSEKADDRSYGSQQKSLEVEAITENASSKSSKVKLLGRIKNIFGNTEPSTSRAQSIEAHVTDISDRTATPVSKTVPPTLNNTEEDSRIEAMNNEGVKKVHQCVSSACLFCEWKMKNDAAFSTGCKEKKIEELKDGFVDAIEHICGYLDVTLSEVNEKSKEQHAYLIIEILRELNTTEGEINAELTKVCNRKFSALKEVIKRRSSNFIKQDFKLKQASVKILREDVMAVNDWISRKK